MTGAKLNKMEKSNLNRTAFWRQLRVVVLICAGNSVTGFMYGWMSPALQKFQEHETRVNVSSGQIQLLVMVSEYAHFFVPIPVGILADMFGRKPLFLFNTVLAAVGWAETYFAKTYLDLMIGRFLQGFHHGSWSTLLSMYIAEVSSKELRGTFGCMQTLAQNTGIFLMFIVAGSNLQTGALFSLIFTTLHLVLILYIVESPYFHAAKGNSKKAAQTLYWLRNNEQIDDELDNILDRVKTRMNPARAMKELFSSANRPGFLLAATLNCLIELSGKAVALMHVTMILSSLRHNDEGSITVYTFTVLVGGINVLLPFVAIFLSDRIGRRILILLASCIGGTMHLLSASWLYFLTDDDTSSTNRVFGLTKEWLLFFSMSGFFCCCSIFLPNIMTLRAELIAENNRGLASGIVSMFMGLALLIAIKLFRDALSYFGSYMSFIILSLGCYLITVISFLYLPETKNKTFEEIQFEIRRKARFKSTEMK